MTNSVQRKELIGSYIVSRISEVDIVDGNTKNSYNYEFTPILPQSQFFVIINLD